MHVKVALADGQSGSCGAACLSEHQTAGVMLGGEPHLTVGVHKSSTI